jgi:hypothetical protein
MCPACITTVALVAAGAGSTGGLTAFLARALHRKRAAAAASAERSAESSDGASVVVPQPQPAAPGESR